MEQMKQTNRMIQFPTLTGIRVSSIRTGAPFQHHVVLLLPIDKAIEKKLDSKVPFKIKWNDSYYTVHPRNVFAYGEIDLDSDEDIDTIYDCKIALPDSGIWIYSNYDYKTNTAKIIDNKLLQYTSFDNLKIFTQCYGMIGCPKEVLLFKVYAPFINRQIK